MARSGKYKQKRKAQGDPLYNNRLINRFTNGIMRDGKKTVAQHEVNGMLEILKEKGQDPVKSFENAIATVSPRMEVRPRRVGGASYQVPTEVRGERRISLAIRWIIGAAKKRSNKEYHRFSEKLAAEILDILQGQGESIKRRDTVQRMADANRAFAHFRW